MPLTSLSSRGKDRSGQIRPSKPSGIPTTRHLYFRMAHFTAARMTAFKPGASPPPVQIPIVRTSVMRSIGNDLLDYRQSGRVAGDISRSGGDVGTACSNCLGQTIGADGGSGGVARRPGRAVGDVLSRVVGKRRSRGVLLRGRTTNARNRYLRGRGRNGN